MKYSTVVFVLIAIAAVGSATAQRKTVSNADLEKYARARLAAEREYRENYARLGFPSPEELAKRNEASQKEMLELSQRLREDELEREKIAAESDLSAGSPVVNVDRDSGSRSRGLAPAFVWSNYGNGWDFNRRGFYRRPAQQRYYVSGGSIWPIGPRTKAQPLVRVNRRR